MRQAPMSSAAEKSGQLRIFTREAHLLKRARRNS